MPKLDTTKRPYPYWPRGTYNGERIVGIDLGLTLWVDTWWWWPTYSKYSSTLCWLCFRLSWGWTYASD